MTTFVVTEPPRPGTPAHTRMITASKIPAILGIDPYRTQGDLWMEMSGLAEPQEPDDDMRDAWAWGHTAEESLARWWQQHNPGWTLNPKRRGTTEIAYSDTDLDFPNLVTLDRRARRGDRYHRLEIKTSASARKWGERGDDLPGDVAAQVIYQAGISGIEKGSVVALVSADRPQRPRIYDAPADPDIYEGIVDAARAFYKTLGREEPPMPDPALLDELAMPPTIDDESVEAPERALANYHATRAALAEAEDDHEQSKQALLAVLGDHHRLLDDTGAVIATQSPGRFSRFKVPDDAKHLLKDPEVQTAKLDIRKFKARYPEIYAAATGPKTVRWA